MKKLALLALPLVLLRPGGKVNEFIYSGSSQTYTIMEHTVKKSIDIKAEPSEVWNALTNPELTKKYFFNCKVSSDWKEGSEISFTGRILLVKKIEMKGKILAIEKNKLLKYNLKNGNEGKTTSTVTDVLSYANGNTTVSVSDDVGEGEGAEKRFKRSEKGWDKILSGLKKTVEENK